MAHVVKHTYQLKRGTAARWIELNPILGPGEPGFEIDTGQLKIGNGKDAWIDLPYVAGNAFDPNETVELYGGSATDNITLIEIEEDETNG